MTQEKWKRTFANNLLDILEEEHEIQQDVFCMMHERGFYPTPEAEQKKVDQLKMQYKQCVK